MAKYGAFVDYGGCIWITIHEIAIKINLKMGISQQLLRMFLHYCLKVKPYEHMLKDSSSQLRRITR